MLYALHLNIYVLHLWFDDAHVDSMEQGLLSHGEMLMVLYVIIYHYSYGICIASYAFIGIWSYVAAC